MKKHNILNLHNVALAIDIIVIIAMLLKQDKYFNFVIALV